MPRRGRRRRKTRTHKEEDDDENRPLVIGVFRQNKLAPACKRLVTDMRKVLYPHTDIQLGAKQGRLEGFDYTVLISNTEKGAYLKINKSPEGPNTTFRIESFSLSSDVREEQAIPMMLQADHTSHAVLITQGIRNDKLVRQQLISLFPPPKSLKVCKRVVLIQSDGETMHFRHFQINRGIVANNPSIKSLSKNKLPDLSEYNSVSDWILENSSPSEPKQPISLAELGPRLTLTLYKIEYKGKMLFHRFKSVEEINESIKGYVAKEELRDKRRRKQEKNVRKKQKVMKEDAQEEIPELIEETNE